MSFDLTIITITYKDIDGLSKTIESLSGLAEIAALSGVSVEHVIIDSSPELSGPLRRVDDGISRRWNNVPANGPYPAFNDGIKASQGEWVQFLNGGDWLLDANKLIEWIVYLKAHPEVQLLCGGARLYREGVYQYDRLPKNDLFLSLAGMNRICHQAILYQKKLFDRYGSYPTEYRTAGDYAHLFELYTYGVICKCVKSVFVAFEMGGISDDYRLAFSEFKKIHRRIEKKLPISQAILNEVLRIREWLKVALIKSLSRSFLAPVLRPFWIWANRR